MTCTGDAHMAESDRCELDDCPLLRCATIFEVSDIGRPGDFVSCDSLYGHLQIG